MAFSPSQLMFVSSVEDPSRGRIEGRLVEGEARDALTAENKQTAVVAQAWIVRKMEGSYKRPTVSTGRLARVTAKPRNAYASSFYYGVGNPYFLEKSEAKYWRTIEEGSAATWTKRSFLTLPLRGTFGSTWGGSGYAGGPFSTPNSSNAPLGKFRPTGPYFKVPGAEGEKDKSYRMPVFFPTHEIAAMGAYAAAWNQGWFQRAGVDAARRYLDKILSGERQSGSPALY